MSNLLYGRKLREKNFASLQAAVQFLFCRSFVGMPDFDGQVSNFAIDEFSQ